MTSPATAPSCFGHTDWTWLNPPTDWSEEADGGLVVRTDADTDFWVTTHYGFVRDTGHALLRPVPATFRMRLTFTGDYREQYDQAGLLLRLDERNWVKTGIEYVDGTQQLSAVVTRDVSDWSVVPLARVTSTLSPVTLDLHREHDTVTIRYGTGATQPDTLLRLGYFPPATDALAGPMCASPDGTGFTTRFTALHFDAL